MSAPAVCNSLMYWSRDLIENYSKPPPNSPLCPLNLFLGENFLVLSRCAVALVLVFGWVLLERRRAAQGRSGFWRKEKVWEPPVKYSLMISWLLNRAPCWLLPHVQLPSERSCRSEYHVNHSFIEVTEEFGPRWENHICHRWWLLAPISQSHWTLTAVSLVLKRLC